jgi:hypothetical protein
MAEYGYTIAEHDPGRPWIIVRSEHRTVELDDGEEFSEWAHAEWPSDRYTVALDPWQLRLD